MSSGDDGDDGDEVTGGGPGTFGCYLPNSSRFPIPAANYHKTDFDSGPMVSYSNRSFNAVLGYQRQLPWAEAFQHASQIEQVNGLNYYEYEKNFLRLKFGVSLR